MNYEQALQHLMQHNSHCAVMNGWPKNQYLWATRAKFGISLNGERKPWFPSHQEMLQSKWTIITQQF